MVASFHNAEKGTIPESALYSSLECTAVGCAVLDASGYILSFTPEFAALIDSPADYLVGQNLFEHLVFAEGDFSQKMMSEVSGVHVTSRKSGRSLSWCMRNMISDDRSSGCFVGTLQVERLSEGFEQRVEHRDRLATLGGVTASLIHEIATPLAIIANNAELLLDVDDVAENATDSLVTIKDEAHRLGELLHDVLRFSRDTPLRAKSNDAVVLVNKAARLLSQKLNVKNLTVRIDAEDELPLLECDAERLQQVFINLIQNACDASSKGGEIVVAARCAAMKSGCAAIEFVITDHGEGIAPSDLDRIFQPFFSSKPVGEGTGLGLAIAHRIVLAHKGTMHIASQVGEGTQVVVTLPQSNSEEASPQRDLFESCVTQ